MSKAALKQIEARNKRVLTKASLESLAQVTSIIRSWLRDVLMIKSQAVEQIVNIDVMNDLEQAAARTTPAGLVRAIDATYRCDKAIAYNVSTEKMCIRDRSIASSAMAKNGSRSVCVDIS